MVNATNLPTNRASGTPGHVADTNAAHAAINAMTATYDATVAKVDALVSQVNVLTSAPAVPNVANLDYMALYNAGVLSARDTDPPVVTVGATVGSTTATVTWTATDASGIKETVVTQALASTPTVTTEIYRGKGTSVAVTQLNSQTAYIWSVTSTDNATTPHTSAPVTVTKTTLLPAGQTFADAFLRSTTGGWGNGWGTFFGQTNTGVTVNGIARCPTDTTSVLRQFKAPTHPTTDAHWGEIRVIGLPTNNGRVHSGVIIRGTDNGAGVATTGYGGWWSSTGGPAGAGGWVISRRAATNSNVATIDATEPSAPYTLRLEISQNVDDIAKVDLRLRINGTSVATGTDANPVPAGKDAAATIYSTVNSPNSSIGAYSNGDIVP